MTDTTDTTTPRASGLAEAIQHVEARTEEHLGVEMIDIPGQPEDRPYVRVGQELRKLTLDPFPRVLRLNTLHDLVALSVEPIDTALADKQRAIFVSHDCVVLYFDTTDLREMAIVSLKRTEEHRYLDERTHDQAVSQSALRTALRVTLDECSPTADGHRTLVEQISKLAWQSSEGHTSALDRDKESMGASVSRSVQSTAGLPPERLTLQVRPYINADLKMRFPVTCILDPNHATQQFMFTPTSSSWAEYAALSLRAVEGVVLALTDDQDVPTPVYLGTATS